jgi:hypothetical protein
MEEMGNFSVTVDPGRDYVEVELRGFLDPQTASNFNDEYRVAKARLSADRSRHVTLIDVSGLKIQAQNIVSDFALMLSDPSIQSARLAFVVADAPVKMQLRRLLHDHAAMFDTVDEARSWLLRPFDA